MSEEKKPRKDKRVMVSMPVDVWQALRAAARARALPMSVLLRLWAIEKLGLERKEENGDE